MSQIYPEIQQQQQPTAPGYGSIPDSETLAKMNELQEKSIKTGSFYFLVFSKYYLLHVT